MDTLQCYGGSFTHACLVHTKQTAAAAIHRTQYGNGHSSNTHVAILPAQYHRSNNMSQNECACGATIMIVLCCCATIMYKIVFYAPMQALSLHLPHWLIHLQCCSVHQLEVHLHLDAIGRSSRSVCIEHPGHPRRFALSAPGPHFTVHLRVLAKPMPMLSST
jgi:hypothetical protein